MSVLDDMRSNAEASHGSFDEAKRLVKQASDEASELAQSAAGHGGPASRKRCRRRRKRLRKR